jgi:hypothetical protein
VRRTTTFIATALVTATALGMSAPAFAKAAPIAVNDACTVVTPKQAAKFGKPVAAAVPGPANLKCQLGVGKDPAAAPGGTLTTLILYPNVFAAHVANAQLGVEDQYAIDQISNQELEDVSGLGTSAYFNATKGEVVFAPNKKLGIILNWGPAPAGTKMSARDRKQLIALAKEVAKRANAK